MLDLFANPEFNCDEAITITNSFASTQIKITREMELEAAKIDKENKLREEKAKKKELEEKLAKEKLELQKLARMEEKRKAEQDDTDDWRNARGKKNVQRDTNQLETTDKSTSDKNIVVEDDWSNIRGTKKKSIFTTGIIKNITNLTDNTNTNTKPCASQNTQNTRSTNDFDGWDLVRHNKKSDNNQTKETKQSILEVKQNEPDDWSNILRKNLLHKK
jgi:hypothetical protein